MNATALLLACLLAAPAAAGEDRPNVVVFVVDDLGWQDTSLALHTERTPFNERYRTPNVERLAAGGMRFSAAYASSPVCTPTRRSIHTGQNPARHRSTNWTLHADRPPGGGNERVAPPAWDADGLGEGDVTLARLLDDAGYRTIHAGKAHLGAVGTSGADPTNLGFDVNIAGHAAGAPGSFLGTDDFMRSKRRGEEAKPSVWDVPGLEAYHGEEVYLTEACTLEALDAVRDAVAADEPFFLHLAHYAVHTPIQADPEYVDAYAGLDPREAAYASMIEGYDASLGAVLDLLEELEVADETWVVFFSDNGGLSAHSRGGAKHAHNAPLRSGKGSAYEGGVRVPLVIAGPEMSMAGHATGEPVIAEDLFPTVLALCGVDVPADHAATLDGQDLRWLLEGQEKAPRRTLGWHYPHQWGAAGPGVGPYSAVRDRRMKLIWFHETGAVELYDLVADLGETNDLAADRPEERARMLGELRAYLARTGAQMPTWRETDEVLAVPE